MYIRYILGGPIERKMPARGPVPHRTDMASHHLLSTPIPSPSSQAVAGSLCWEKIWSTAARDTKAAATGSTQLLPPTPEAPHSSIPLSESGAAYIQLWRWFQDHVAHSKSFAGSRAPTKWTRSLTDDQVSTAFFSKQETCMECSLMREGKILSCLCDVPTE